MWLINFFLRIFRRKKQRLWDANSLYDQFLNRYGLSVDGQRFFDIGNSVNHFQDTDKYIDEYINPLFENINNDVEEHVNTIVHDISQQISEIDKEIVEIKSYLDEKNETGFLHNIDLKINVSTVTEKEIECIVFPEKELQKMISKTLEQFEKSMSPAVVDAANNPLILNNALQQKEIFGSVKALAHNFKMFLDSLSTMKHSLLHPPRPIYIYLFYFICIILLIAEIGFSMTIIQKMLNTNITWIPNSDTVFAILYSIGIALSFAILMKQLIEKYLFKGEKRIKELLLIMIPIYIALLVLFFANNDELWDGSKHPWPEYAYSAIKAIVLSFFSITFAAANAFLFREASYLHHLHFRLNGRLSVRKLSRKRNRYVAKWEARLTAITKERAVLNERKSYYTLALTHVKQMFNNLKTVSISSYLRGFDIMIAGAIRKNEDLVVALMSKLKTQLKK